jgi:hypothetical protein
MDANEREYKNENTNGLSRLLESGRLVPMRFKPIQRTSRLVSNAGS